MKLICALLMAAASAHAATLVYQHDFTGNSAEPLDGVTVGSSSGTLGGTTGATWTAGDIWRADGSTLKTASQQDSAYLPFSPVDGYFYRISATVSIDEIGTGDYWVAMSLLDGTPQTETGFHALDTTYASIGRRASDYSGNNLLRWAGPKNGNSAHLSETTAGPWRLSILLDTTVPGDWNFQLQMEGGTSTNIISNSYAIPANSVDYIMFTNFRDVTASVSGFEVMADPVPEPAVLSISFALPALLLRRRRRD